MPKKESAPFNFDGDENLNQSVENLGAEIPEASPEKMQEASRVLQAQGVLPADESSAPAPASEGLEQNGTAPQASSIEVDSDGVVFDSKIHTGSKLKNGKWRTRKGATSTVGGTTKKPAASAAQEMTPQQKAEAARMAGLVMAGVTFTAGQIVGGEEWKPDDSAEVDLMAKAWADYLQSKNVTDVPPGVALSMTLIGYAAKRFTRPKTQEKVGRIKRWFALRIARAKLRKVFGKDRVTIRDGVLLVDGKEHK